MTTASSRANEVRVELAKENDLIYLSVKDNGVGFDPKKGTRGLGFRNIISRANLYNGQVSIESQPGSGTELRVTFRYSDKASTP